MTAPAPAKYPGSGQLRLRNPASSSVFLECSCYKLERIKIHRFSQETYFNSASASTVHCTVYSVQPTIPLSDTASSIGWSDIYLFLIIENGHYAADQVYFYESNSKKWANLAPFSQPMCGKVFAFKKSQGPKK